MFLNDSPIEFVDIPQQYADVTKDILDGLAEIMRKGTFVGGSVLEKFEAKLATYVGTKYAVGCSDGTAALKLVLLAAGIEKGDGVVVPTNSFIASANAAVHAGGKPILVDCDSETYLIDLNQVEDAFKSGKVRFVLPVHLYGNPCPMKEFLELADKYGVMLIEDNAQAIGAKLDGQRTGSFGLAGGISFYPAKNLGSFGQGGAVVTNYESIAKKVRMYAEQGQGTQKYYHDVIGYNNRLHSIQAYVLDVMLGKLDGFNAARLQVADWYSVRLPLDHIQKRTVNSVPVYHLFEYRCESAKHRSDVADALKSKKIGFGYHYPVPIHKQKAYREFNDIVLPVAESLADTLISLPMHPFLTKEEVNRVCDTILSK